MRQALPVLVTGRHGRGKADSSTFLILCLSSWFKDPAQLCKMALHNLCCQCVAWNLFPKGAHSKALLAVAPCPRCLLHKLSYATRTCKAGKGWDKAQMAWGALGKGADKPAIPRALQRLWQQPILIHGERIWNSGGFHLWDQLSHFT